MFKGKRIKLKKNIIKFKKNCRTKFKQFKWKILAHEFRIKEIQISKRPKVRKMIGRINKFQINKKTEKKPTIWKN